MNPTPKTILAAFCDICGVPTWTPSDDQMATLVELYNFAVKKKTQISSDIRKVVIEAINQKLDLNHDSFQDIMNTAFRAGVKLNYHVKCDIRSSLDSNDPNAFAECLHRNRIDAPELLRAFHPVSVQTSHAKLQEAIETDPKSAEILRAIFSRSCFNLFPRSISYSFFAKTQSTCEDFFDFISFRHPGMTDRSLALYVIEVDSSVFTSGYENGCGYLLSQIRTAYSNLHNHCELAVIIPHLIVENIDAQWRLYKDIILYAEKFQSDDIRQMYFKKEKVKSDTINYIPEIDSAKASLDLANCGFVFKDCFVIQQAEDRGYSLLLILEKNKRDERLLNCPACRSTAVQGNSYPILNVKSWECENPLCPDRSKYNRGKRYSFQSLERQRLLQDDQNAIPQSLISRWHLDCVRVVAETAIFEMLIRCFSCVGDGITIQTNGTSSRLESFGRIVKTIPLRPNKHNNSILRSFLASSYFARYCYLKHNHSKGDFSKTVSGKATVYHGEAFNVLSSMPSNSISAAVTSPPYYNAKEYSQWPNIYCYLYDMFNIANQVFRVMKPHGVFLFNIFDYFDNENNIVFSAMGKKRMILGAYLLDIFERVGFTILGNIIWNKGEINGNRSFNQGNLTPYYQSPLNCWEHIFLLSKGRPHPQFSQLSSIILNLHPVVKIVKGKNVLGHTAPFPAAIPELIVRCLSENDIVLDPFLGSGTTCLVAQSHNVSSVGIEMNKEYFDLCIKRITSQDEQLVLPL